MANIKDKYVHVTVDKFLTTEYALHMIEETLKALDFNPKEIAVYLAILKHSKITPASIAKITGIKRPTVYSVINELLDKEVIVEDLASDQSFFLALPPQNLTNIISKEEREIQKKKGLISQAVEQLQEFTKNTKYSIPKIQFVYEEDIEKFLYKQTPLWNESVLMRDNTWWGFQDPSFADHYQKWIGWFWNTSAPKEIQLKLLTNQAPIEKEMEKKEYDRRSVKFWTKGGNFTASTLVVGDYLLLIMTAQSPHYLVQINDSILAHNMREVFKNIWNDEQ
jgi:predicted DNA-binding transcriptional regulator